MVDPLLECPLVVRIALRTTPETQLLAEVIPAFAADGALPACNAHLQGNSVSYLEPSHLWSDGDNLAGRLVAQRQWVAGTEIAIGELFVVGNI